MKKILLIEDESTLQKILGEELKKNGYDILNALNGEIGLRLAEKEKPDLILLDLVMPVMDGFEVLEKLQKDEKTKNIPVIILTNLERLDNINKTIQLGAKGYLIKSDYKIDEVIKKIEGVIN